MIYIAHTQR